MKKNFFLFLVCLSLVACGRYYSYPDTLRKGYVAKDVFIIEKDYQLVYTDILKKMDQCISSHKEMFIMPESGKAEIKTKNDAYGYYMVVDIEKLPGKKTQTQVDVYAADRYPLFIPRQGAFNKEGCYPK